MAYQSCRFPDGRRAIVDLFAPGDIVGLETVLFLRASGTVMAAGSIAFAAVPADFHQLMETQEYALCLTSLLIEARRRCEELAARIARLEAPERVVAMLIDFSRPAAAPKIDRTVDL